MSERFNVADIFGENVFNDTVIDVYKRQHHIHSRSYFLRTIEFCVISILPSLSSLPTALSVSYTHLHQSLFYRMVCFCGSMDHR